MSNHQIQIFDKADGTKAQAIDIDLTWQGIDIMPEGYGDACTENGHGSPIMVELWEGELRVVIWGDINQEDPTHIISLEGAREHKREKEIA